MVTISNDNIDELYTDTLWWLRACYASEETRGGKVRAFQVPVLWELTNPRNRVLINPLRDANPFFHVMEFIWMMSGEGRIKWVAQFSKNYANFAEDWAGYGWRWRKAFGFDQIAHVIEVLKKHPDTRRAVLEMWEPARDHHLSHKEVPCNTHIYFRVVGGKLDMTVLNRSNDIIWGALGANIVHMTMLHELIAFGCGQKLGTYRAFSTNAHMYENMPRFNELWHNQVGPVLVEQCRPILREGEDWKQFIDDCCNMVCHGVDRNFQTDWMNQVGLPIYRVFFDREINSPGHVIQCPAWAKACEMWLARRKR